MFTLTIREALTIQRAQMAYYRQNIGRAGIKAINKQTVISPECSIDEPLPVSKINSMVPRGGSFERYIKPVSLRRETDPTSYAWHSAIRAGKVFSL